MKFDGFESCLQWPELAPRISSQKANLQTAEPHTATAAGDEAVGSGPDQAEDFADPVNHVTKYRETFGGASSRANGNAAPIEAQAGSVAAAVPQELAELLDVGKSFRPLHVLASGTETCKSQQD